MDPNKTLVDMLQKFLLDGNYDDASYVASNLGEWLGRGGFYPTTLDERLVDVIVDALTTDSEFGCNTYACSIGGIRNELLRLFSLVDLSRGLLVVVGDVAGFYDKVML